MAIKLLFVSSWVVLILFSCKKQEGGTSTQTDPVEKQLREGLIAYYPFNNNSNDESGNNYNLIVKGAVLTSNRFGEPSKAYSFNGINTLMEIPRLQKADSVRQVTISVWVKTEQLTDECILSFLPKEPICSYSLGFANNSNINMYRTNHKMVTTNSRSNCTTSIIGDNITNPLNKWCHIVLVQKYNTDNPAFPRSEYSQYFDGSKLSAGGASPFGSNPIATSFNNGGTIGSNNTTGNNDFNYGYFKGSIDDVRIYNRALSEEEILKLFSLHD
ncbi:MAG: tolB [Segetibacter sp.]|nr:tolB [Segetibacter sp.]